MSGRELVPAERLQEELTELPGWRLDGKRLFREFKFADFAGAFGFMCGVALVAQRLDHHPDWSNVYDTVQIHLSTHDLGGVSTWDLRLAREIDRLAGPARG